MPKFFCFLLGCLLCSVSLLAQAPKFGHVNSAEIIQAMPEIKALQTKIDAKQDEIEKQLTILKEDFNKQIEAYQKQAEAMTEAQRNAKEQELMTMQERIDNFIQTSRQDIVKMQQEGFVPVQQKIMQKIQEVGAQLGYLYIFELNQGVMPYAGAKSDDLTKTIMQNLGVQATK